MRVLIAGSTGVLGRRIAIQLKARGHEVHAFVRNNDAERLLSSKGINCHLWDARDSLVPHTLPSSIDVVINAVSKIPVASRPSGQAWLENDAIRINAARQLGALAGQRGAKLFVQQSVVWVARPNDGSPFDETSPPNPPSTEVSALESERIVMEAAKRYGFNAAVLRCGWFYGPDSQHTLMFASLLRRRRLPIIGTGEAFWSILHLDDAASAFIRVAEQSQGGLWHIVDDRPMMVSEFLNEFARQLAATPPLRVPLWLARLVAGAYAVQFFTTSTRTSNLKFKEAFGWQPAYPSFVEGLAHVVPYT